MPIVTMSLNNKYEVTNSSGLKTFPEPRETADKVGCLLNGCVIEGAKSNNGWMRIEKIISTEEYYKSVCEGMFCRAENDDGTKQYFKEKKDTNTQAETGNGSEGVEESETMYADDAFTDVYSTRISDNDYLNNLQNGLEIKNLRGIMGLPHQFLPNTDPRIDGDNSNVGSFGRVYAEKIIAPMPLLFMTPGTPSFMASFNKKQKGTILENIFNKTTEIGDFDDLTGSDGGKYYSLKYAYIDYFGYVNAMLRSAAFFLDIQDETLDIDDETTGSGGKKLGSLNWFYQQEGESDIFDNNGLSRFLGVYAGAIPFYVEAETKVSDSFGNSTSQSSLASSIDGLSDTARELNYLIGNVAGNIGAGGLYDEVMGLGGSLMENTSDTINSLLGKGNILSNMMGKLQTILSGGRMIFPEIWSDSSFSRSYNISLKLVSPSGDKLSIFYNILVPIYHLMAFVLPRNSTGQAFYSPFLVRAYYKGIFNIDMGIITDMNISKGADGEWTPDGLPTVAEVSFEIKDLYDVLAMSKQDFENDRGILSNIAELDYIANSCGININEPEVGRTIKMAATLGFSSKLKDKFTMNMFGNVTQYFNQKVQNIFGKF